LSAIRTCAGDAFAAGFFARISAGLPHAESVRLGNRRRRLGHDAGQPSWDPSYDDVVRLIEKEAP